MPSKSKPCLFHLYILWLSPGQLNNPSISFPIGWLFSTMNFFGQWINVLLTYALSPLPEGSYSLTIPQVKTRWLRVTPKGHTVRARNKPCCLDHQDFRMLCRHSLAPPIMMDKSLRLNIILITGPLPVRKKKKSFKDMSNCINNLMNNKLSLQDKVKYREFKCISIHLNLVCKLRWPH